MEGKGNEHSPSSRLPKLPTDLIYSAILPRLPVKSIFRFKAVSHEWCSRLGEPSFVKSYLARSLEDERVGHFIWTYKDSTKEHHFLINPDVWGQDSYLLKLEDTTSKILYLEHVNGLFLLCYGDGRNEDDVLIINPSTKQMMDIPKRCPNETYFNTNYSLGFDPSSQEFKILSIQISTTSSPKPIAVCGIFSLGTTNTWRTIDIEFPFNIVHPFCRSSGGVSINGILHWIVPKVHAAGDIIEGYIIRFDFKKEKFSRLDLPSEVVRPVAESTTANNEVLQPAAVLIPGNDEVQESDLHNHYLIDVDSCLALVYSEKVEQDNTMDIWILKDYQKQVWVKNSIKFPDLWRDIGAPFPVCSSSKGSVMFSPYRDSEDCIVAFLYDLETKTFTEYEVTLPRSLRTDDLNVDCIRIYAANILSVGDKIGHRKLILQTEMQEDL